MANTSLLIKTKGNELKKIIRNRYLFVNFNLRFMIHNWYQKRAPKREN